MTHFFEHIGRMFVCPICRRNTEDKDKAWIMIRKRNNNRVDDRRKNMICKSTSCCVNCYEKIEKFIEGMSEK